MTEESVHGMWFCVESVSWEIGFWVGSRNSSVVNEFSFFFFWWRGVGGGAVVMGWHLVWGSGKSTGKMLKKKIFVECEGNFGGGVVLEYMVIH